jgi:predicted methyltransferase
MIKSGMFRATAAIAAVAMLAGASLAQAGDDIESRIDRAMTGEHRSDRNMARDKYRHPKETLLFFGLEPQMTVVEITPGAGWYSEILAPVLRNSGTFYAGIYKVSDGSPDIIKRLDGMYRGLIAANPGVYDQVKLSVFDPAAPKFAPDGSADMVLTFRNIHNWAKAGNIDLMIQGFHAALKSGGVLGVVEHRAKPGTSFQQQIDSGYMTEQYVVEVIEKAGFRLVNRSEINANPLDSADHPGGVWNLPPNLRNVTEADKPKYLAIGESDRMTLKFVKP